MKRKVVGLKEEGLDWVGEEKRGKGGRGWIGVVRGRGTKGGEVKGTGVTHYMLSKRTI